MKPLDKSKDSNRKCEHCEFFSGNRKSGKCYEDRYVVLEVKYWKTCDKFTWRKTTFKPNQIPFVPILQIVK